MKVYKSLRAVSILPPSSALESPFLSLSLSLSPFPYFDNSILEYLEATAAAVSPSLPSYGIGKSFFLSLNPSGDQKISVMAALSVCKWETEGYNNP